MRLEVAQVLQAENLSIVREGRDFTIKDRSNKLLQRPGGSSKSPFEADFG